MIWKKLWKRIARTEAGKAYPNRFLKFYHENKRRLLKERKGAYYQKKKSGACVRCHRKALSSIIFCSYHQQKQVGYNQKARKKNQSK